MRNKLDKVELYVKTGEFTEETYSQLKSHVYYLLTNSNYHYHFGIPLNELVTEIVSHVTPDIAKFDSSKGMSLKNWINYTSRHYIHKRYRTENYQKRAGAKDNVPFEYHITDTLAGDHSDNYSFKLAMERNVFAHEDKEFVSACLLYWTFNADNYFQGGQRLYAAKKIIEVLLSGKTYENMSYGKFITHVLKLNSRQAFHQVLNVMRIVNKALYRKWISEGHF